MKLTCSICNNKFVKTTIKKKYCSKECSKKGIIEWRKEYSKNHAKEKALYDKLYYKKYNQRILIRNKRAYKKNKHRDALTMKKYYNSNKETIKIRGREYYRLYKNEMMIKSKIYARKRRKTDISFKLLCYLRNRIYYALIGKNKSKSTRNLIGCSVEQLKSHLQSKFTKGMAWNNYGKWHVDHIKPCCSFDLSKPEEQEKCFNYTNLQPLWAKDNLRKSGTFKKVIDLEKELN